MALRILRNWASFHFGGFVLSAFLAAGIYFIQSLAEAVQTLKEKTLFLGFRKRRCLCSLEEKEIVCLYLYLSVFLVILLSADRIACSIYFSLTTAYLVLS